MCFSKKGFLSMKSNRLYNLIGILLTIYLTLKPLYVLNDSPFQVADIILIIAFIFVLAFRIKKRLANKSFTAENSIKLYSVFVVYLIVVNVCSYLSLSGSEIEKTSLIKNNLYYLFNLLALIFVYQSYRLLGNSIKRFFCFGCFTSMIIVALGIALKSGLSSRNSGFFDNPNQLGYYCVLMLTSVILLNNSFKLLEKITIILIGAAGVLFSESIASVVAFVISLFLFFVIKSYSFIANGNRLKFDLKTAVVVLLMVVILIMVYLKFNNVFLKGFDTLVARLNTDSDLSINLGASRGYNRIGEIGASIITGVGEGAFFRFKTMVGNETHSSYATILVSYGIIGSLIFALFFRQIVHKSFKTLAYFMLVFTGPLLYSFSHNGLRNTILWMLIMLFCLFVYDKQKTNERVPTNDKE